MLDVVNGWFGRDGSLKSGAGALVDPYALERKMRGESPYRCERTRENILHQALYFACRNARLEVAEVLLRRGADINAIVPGLDSQATILHLVAGSGAGRGEVEPVVRFLLDRGASLGVRDAEYDATPLGWAVYLKQEKAVALLRSLGAPE
jgi:ankyrin repeat protein